jgi:osmotically-inducible protein OsmY
MNERYDRDYYDDDDGREDWNERNERSERSNRGQRDFSRGERERSNWTTGRNAQGSAQASERSFGQGSSQYGQGSRFGQGRSDREDYSGELGRYGNDRRYSGGSYARDAYFAGPWRGESSRYGLGSEPGEVEQRGRPWDSQWGRSGERSGRDDDWSSRNSGYERGSYGGSMGSMRQGGFGGKGPKGYVRSDERIREDVCDRLSIDDEVDASDITVNVKNGEVTLEGTVPDRRSKHRAEDITESVSGVKEIHNSLRPQKGLLQEIGDRVTGRAESEQHGHSGAGPRNGTSANRL